MALQTSVGWVCTTSQRSELSPLMTECAGARGDCVTLGRQNFFGCAQSLRCSPSYPPSPLRGSKFSVVTAVIKRRKEYQLDNVIQREKKLKIVLRIKELLVKQPGHVMSLRDLGKNRKYIGLTGKRRCIALLQKFPAVFQVYEEGVNAKWFRLTREANAQFLEELKLKEEMEGFLVTKVRKLLMMSIDKRILLEKVGHIRRELGLPEDFKTNLVLKFPQYFRVVETEMGSALELTAWDPELAVCAIDKAAEEKAKARKELEEDLAKSLGDEAEDLFPRVPRFKKVNLPKGFNLSKRDKEKLLEFQEVPYISPYSDTSQLHPASKEAEKHAVAVVHELLSLTLEKKLLVDHLTHFRRDYQFSQRVRSLLIRHPETFYVSLKGTRDSVFLREAYHNSDLKEKDPLVLVKERVAELIAKGRKAEKLDDISEDEEDEEDNEDDEDDEDDDGDWDDEDEETFVGKVANLSVQQQRIRFGKGNVDSAQSPPASRRELVTLPRERW